jgi:hypothetical protein
MGYDITVCVVDIQRWQEEYLSVLGQGTAHPFIASEIKFLNTLYDSDNYDIEYNITNKKDFCGIDKVMASASSDYRHFSINRRCCGKHGMFYEEGYPTKL